MSKTYSVAILGKDNKTWFTNWGQYFKLDDIDWQEVESHCLKNGNKGYGYYYGHKSRNLTSSRCRTIVKLL